jgi:predicted transport protein
MLFRLREGSATRIEPYDRPVREKEIQELLENNLEEFSGLTLLCHKARIEGKEIDTLAFDRAIRAPVIIEYKRGKDRHVIGQVAEYCARVRANKLAVMQMLKEKGITHDTAEVDFDCPQIYVVAKEFSPDQVQAFSELRIIPRLFRFQFYADGIVRLEELPVEEGSHGARKNSRRKGQPEGASPGVDHFGMKPGTRELYDQIDAAITKLDSRVKPAKVNKEFIGYRATGFYFCSVKPTKKALNIFVKCKRSPALPAGVEVRKLPQGRWGPMTHTFKISDKRQVRPALRIIRSALGDSI